MKGCLYCIAAVSALLLGPAPTLAQSPDTPQPVVRGEHGELLDRPRPSEAILQRLTDNGISPDDDDIDRLVRTAHRMEMRGDSTRKNRPKGNAQG